MFFLIPIFIKEDNILNAPINIPDIPTWLFWTLCGLGISYCIGTTYLIVYVIWFS